MKHYSKILFTKFIYHVTQIKNFKLQLFDMIIKFDTLERLIFSKSNDFQRKIKNKFRQMTKNNKI